MPKYRKRSAKEWAAIHANQSKSKITFNAPRETQYKVARTNYVSDVSSKRFYNDAETLKLQKMRQDLRKSAISRRAFNTIAPNKFEATVSPVPGFLSFKATWEK